MKGISWL